MNFLRSAFEAVIQCCTLGIANRIAISLSLTYELLRPNRYLLGSISNTVLSVVLICAPPLTCYEMFVIDLQDSGYIV